MNKTGSLILVLFLVVSYGAVAQDRQSDSLLQLLPEAKADTNAVLLYIEIGAQYNNSGDVHDAAEYYLKAIELSHTLNYPHGVYDASDLYAFILKRLGMYDSAIAVNREVMEYAFKNNDFGQVADEKLNIGVGYAFKSYNETALVYYMEALAWYEQAGRFDDVAEMYFQIQTVYSRMSLFEEAIRYGEKALSFVSDTLTISYGYILLNLSKCYCNLHPPQNEKALHLLQKALQIAKLKNSAIMEARTHSYIASVYFNTNQLNECELYYRKAISVFSEEYLPNDFCIANIGLANVAFLRNDFKQAEESGLKNLEVSRRYGLRIEERNALSILWELSAANHDCIGKSNLEIADKLCLGYETIKTYRKRLMLKLNVSNSAELVKMAIEQQLV